MKLGVFILCHHKQWLLKSTLLTLFLQKNIKNYELNFVLILGGGKIKRKFFNEQLSKFDKDLLDLIKKIEFMLGRKKRKKKNMPRTIDIDILVHGESIMETEELIIPHPNLIHRKFVLIPFDEIAPDYKIPLIKLTVHELLVNCVDDSFVGLHDMENKA